MSPQSQPFTEALASGRLWKACNCLHSFFTRSIEIQLIHLIRRFSCKQAKKHDCAIINIISKQFVSFLILFVYLLVRLWPSSMTLAQNVRDWGSIPCWGTKFFCPWEPTATFGTQYGSVIWSEVWGLTFPKGGECYDGQLLRWSSGMVLTKNVRHRGSIPCWHIEFFCLSEDTAPFMTMCFHAI